MVFHLYFDFNAFNVVIKIYPENILRIQFIRTEKIKKIEKCNFVECHKTPLFLVNMSYYSINHLSILGNSIILWISLQ